jgi:hypothetical protein
VITIIVLAVAAGIAIPLMLLKFVVRVLVWLKRRRAQLTAYRRGLRRGTEGTFLLAACIYAATWFPLFLGRSLGDLAQALWRAPGDHPGIAVFFAIASLGLLWIGTGLRGARGGGDERDWMSAFWAALIGFGCLAGLWWQWFPSPDRTYLTLLQIASLKTFYIATASAGLVRLWLTVPFFGGNALRRIVRHIKARAPRLRPVRPRSF